MNLSRPDLGDLYVFLNLARHGGFRKAAAELDVSASALSHALRGLESRLGVQLLNKSKSAVILTQAGEELLERCRQGFGEIERGVEALDRFRSSVEGRLRLSVLGDAALLVIGPVIAQFAASHPDVQLEVEVRDAVVDIVNEGFSAGVRFGGTITEDIDALPIGAPLEWIMVASPTYLARRGEPFGPDDLRQHRCIGVRMGNGEVCPWHVGNGAERHPVNLRWSVIVNEPSLAIDVAARGGGIAYCLKNRVLDSVQRGALRQVLPSWTSEGEAFHIHLPKHKQQSSALRDFVLMLQGQVEATGSEIPIGL